MDFLVAPPIITLSTTIHYRGAAPRGPSPMRWQPQRLPFQTTISAPSPGQMGSIMSRKLRSVANHRRADRVSTNKAAPLVGAAPARLPISRILALVGLALAGFAVTYAAVT